MRRRGFMALLPALPFVGKLVKEIPADEVTGGFAVPKIDGMRYHPRPTRHPFFPSKTEVDKMTAEEFESCVWTEQQYRAFYDRTLWDPDERERLETIQHQLEFNLIRSRTLRRI